LCPLPADRPLQGLTRPALPGNFEASRCLRRRFAVICPRVAGRVGADSAEFGTSLGGKPVDNAKSGGGGHLDLATILRKGGIGGTIFTLTLCFSRETQKFEKKMAFPEKRGCGSERQFVNTPSPATQRCSGGAPTGPHWKQTATRREVKNRDTTGGARQLRHGASQFVLSHAL